MCKSLFGVCIGLFGVCIGLFGVCIGLFGVCIGLFVEERAERKALRRMLRITIITMRMRMVKKR